MHVLYIYNGSGLDKRETLLTYYDSGPMNGEVHTSTSPIGQLVSFEYDNNGRIIKQVLPDLREIIYTYDANGNLKSLTPPSRPTHQFNYNGMDQETQYTPPDLVSITNDQTSYTYNLDQQITKITRPDGLEINFNYNSITGKLESKVIPTGNYTYDYHYETNVVGVQIGTGKMIQATSPGGIIIDYTFDGFLPLSTTWSGNQVGSVSRTYDDLFRVTSHTINGTDTINYGYDNDNLLTTAGAMIISRELQKDGAINGTTLGNISTTNSYSSFAELDNFNAQYTGADIYNADYIRDKLGRIITKTETINTVATIYEYEYDLVGRLIEEKTNSIITSAWDYDENSNRTHIDGNQIATYDDQDRLLTYDGNIYTYTDNGELLTKTNGVNVTSYNYDVLGNLLSVTQPDGTLIEYLIGPRDRRVGKKINGTLVRGWLYKDKLNPIAELDATGNIV
jgi:YD repeat-containing protein